MKWFSQLAALDRRLSRAMHVREHSLYKTIATISAHLGDGPIWLVVWIGGILLFKPPVRWQMAAWFIASILAAVFTYSIKFLFKRRRPHERYGFEIGNFYSKGYDKHAFPSGHATRMGTLPVFGAWIFPHYALAFWAISLICIWARVALGVHYVGDVIAGWLIGAAAGLLIILLYPIVLNALIT